MSEGSPKCPVCGSSETKPVERWRDPVAGKDYDLLECAGCGLVYARPLVFPGGDWYEKFNYVDGYAETAAQASKTDFAYFLDLLPSPARGRMLDVGCAAGHFLRMAAARGYDVEGLEVDDRFVKMARDAGTPVTKGILDEAFARSRAGTCDVVSMLEVLEHVDDPRGFLKLAARILKPGGRLLVAVPDNSRPTPFGRDYFDYPPHHLTRWKQKPLGLALESAGLRVETLTTKPFPAIDLSRIWADRSAQALLRVYKRLRYGKEAAKRPMSEILAAGTPAGAAPPPSDKEARLKLVYFYHDVFNAAAWPLFGLMTLYYRLTRPGMGHTLLAVARKD